MLRTGLSLGIALALMAACQPASQAPTGSDTAPSSGSGEVAAVLGDHEITLADVDEVARENDIAPYQALYDARSQALQDIIEDVLVGAEAEKRGIDEETLLEQEIRAKVPDVTDVEVAQFYEENKGQMQGATLEQIAPRIQQFLQAQVLNQRRDDFLGELRQGLGLRVLLEPPRIEVTVLPEEPAFGPATAAVTIVEYSDFQ